MLLSKFDTGNTLGRPQEESQFQQLSKTMEMCSVTQKTYNEKVNESTNLIKNAKCQLRSTHPSCRPWVRLKAPSPNRSSSSSTQPRRASYVRSTHLSITTQRPYSRCVSVCVGEHVPSCSPRLSLSRLSPWPIFAYRRRKPWRLRVSTWMRPRRSWRK